MRGFAVLAALVLMAAMLAAGNARITSAATPSPGVAGVTLTVEPMLGAKFEGGSWAAFRVLVANDGPTIDGELRLTRSTQGSSTFARAVQLATGARQEHVLYGQMGPLNTRFEVALVSGSTVLATHDVAIDGRRSDAVGVYVVAERPERLVGFVGDAVAAGSARNPDIVTVSPELLPLRVEPWASVDVLVWQDVDSIRLGAERVAALRDWVALGGRLVIVGGSTGAATLGAFPPELMPYQPSAVLNVPAAELAAVLGTDTPTEAAPVPALGGDVHGGTVIAQSAGTAVAATMSYGQGAIALIGTDVTTPWLATTGANALWADAFGHGERAYDAFRQADEGFIASALSGLPAVQLPPFNDVVLLLLAYVAAIGPLNYFILRRRDRREWAWVTMPMTMLVFAVASYGLGVLFKGTDVVINELAIVTVAPGTDRGQAQVYAGVYSPNRAEFDVHVGGNPLLAATAAVDGGINRFGDPELGHEQRPVDVLLGDRSTLRGYSVGFGALRAFRAQTAVAAPRVDTAFRLDRNSLVGTLTNASAEALSDVNVVFGSAVQRIGDIGPGETKQVDLELDNAGDFFGPVWERIVPAGFAPDTTSLAGRRAIIQHLAGGWQADFGRNGRMGDIGGGASSGLSSAPVVLAWKSGSTLDIDVGGPAEHIGERLYVIPTRADVSGPIVFAGGLIRSEFVESDSGEAYGESGMYYMGRGTLIAEYSPPPFDGSLSPTKLLVHLAQFEFAATDDQGEVLPPLPPDEQPDPDQPLASNSDREAVRDVPRMQLFDRITATWVEFEPLDPFTTHEIADPARYLDVDGTLRVRFVHRDANTPVEFGFGVRIEGTIE